MEIWKQITDYGGLYYISNLGRIKDTKCKIRATYFNNKDYECASLRYKNKTYHPLVHRLVAKYFIHNPNNFTQVNHIDCNKCNNIVTNLEWVNQRKNYDHGMAHFLYSKNESHFYAKLKNRDVEMLNKLLRLGFTRATVSKIFNINPSSIEAIEKGISYRALNLNWDFPRTKYKDLSNILLPWDIREYFKDNTVLNTLISEGKVSV